MRNQTCPTYSNVNVVPAPASVKPQRSNSKPACETSTCNYCQVTVDFKREVILVKAPHMDATSRLATKLAGIMAKTKDRQQKTAARSTRTASPGAGGFLKLIIIWLLALATILLLSQQLAEIFSQADWPYHVLHLIGVNSLFLLIMTSSFRAAGLLTENSTMRIIETTFKYFLSDLLHLLKYHKTTRLTP